MLVTTAMTSMIITVVVTTTGMDMIMHMHITKMTGIATGTSTPVCSAPMVLL